MGSQPQPSGSSSGINLQFEIHGVETHSVPVNVQILDSSLRRVQERWQPAGSSQVYLLEPGLYCARASLSSGQTFQQVVQVRAGETQPCVLPLYQASPHESQEWAYFTQLIEAPGKRILAERRYRGAWLRLWQRMPDGAWKVLPFPQNVQVENIEDGTSYHFQSMESGFYAIQVGGLWLPWKCVALPSTYNVRVLIRPSSAPAGSTHPLEVVVCSDDWRSESLLSLIQRGDISAASELVEQTGLAEQLLYQKMADSNSAAIGGYFLLRVGSLNRLHHWASNLDQWFPWMPDGAIIHAWQLIRQVGQDPTQKENLMAQARARLLEAVRRGFPLYTEGNRLLRDGLIYFDQRLGGADPEIGRALEGVGEYTAAADWSAANTTFTGAAPGQPSAKSRRGTPRERNSLVYVYDVPLKAALQSGALKPGDELISEFQGTTWRCKVTGKGILELPDGRRFKSLAEMQDVLTGSPANAWWDWRVASPTDPYRWMNRIIDPLRTNKP